MTQERDDSILAAEYVLGLLEPEMHAEAERRAVRDATFARRVDYWRSHFSGFDETADPVTPNNDLWKRIERQIAEAKPVEQVSTPVSSGRFWNSIGALRIGFLGSTLAAIACAMLAVVSVQQARDIAARKPLYVAILVDDATKQAGAVVNAFADGRVEMIPLADINVPEGRALEIWTLWDRAVGPRSVGLIARAQTTHLNLEKLPATSADQLFEITLEPAGGSPIGRPTGPILYKGTTARAL